MDVLNTYGGGTEWAVVVLGIMFFGLAAYVIYSAFDAISDGFYFFGIVFWVCAVISIVLGLVMVNQKAPVSHEVTLRPGYVIDAAKYEVIEQRGAIYVIEEREVSE